MPEPAPRWRIATSASGVGAIAVIELTGESSELDAMLPRLGLPALPAGSVVLRNLCGVDEGLVVRWSPESVHLMPHGGLVVVQEITRALTAAGLAEDLESDPKNILRRYPEARNAAEARMLDALSRAPSPRAIDLLLDQPRRWALHEAGELPGPDPGISAALDHLLHPPLVAAIGGANIGKSTLTNALAGDHVSIVADEPGTTRDHVGALLTLDGLVVRFVDTPGIREGADELERRAMHQTWELLRRANLVLNCGDADTPPISPSALQTLGPLNCPVVTVALRADRSSPLACQPAWTPDLATSARTGEGISALAALIRGTLVPEEALADPRPWGF